MLITTQHERREGTLTYAGHVFEKSLIETYVTQNGTDPISNQDLSIDDLIPVNTSQDPVVRPRPPTLTSIPALLAAFQTEWDAMALETFTLRQQLKQARQEVASALYHHDAAVRVAARLAKERDEAREALAQLAASIGKGGVENGVKNGEIEQPVPLPKEKAVEGAQAPAEFPQDVVDAILSKRQELTATRKKRKPPAGWATSELINAIPKTARSTSKQLFTTVSSAASDPTKQFLLSGGGKSQAGVFSLKTQSIVAPLKTSGIVTGAAWTDANALLLGTKNGHVDIFNYSPDDQSAAKAGDPINLAAHGRVVAVKAHPVSDLAVVVSTVAASKSNPEPVSSWSLLSLGTGKSVATVSSAAGTVYTSVAVHPDGVLVAIGTAHGTIQIHDLSSGGKQAAIFDVGQANTLTDAGEVTALSFSENGYWLVSAASKIPGTAQLWDLRKLNQTAVITFPAATAAGADSIVHALAFDYTGQYLACATSAGVLDVVGYTKATKSWTVEESLFSTAELAVPVAGLEWGALGMGVVTVSGRGVVQTFLGEGKGDVEMTE